MKNAVILMNLGTPVAPTQQAVRRFLCEFLSDRRVVEVPRPIWWTILYGIILPFRTPRVTRAYQSIWQDGQSPLRKITESQVEKLEAALRGNFGQKAPLVRHAMTYSGPSLSAVVSELHSVGVDNILVLPLYPQFSATTTGSIYDQLARLTTSCRNIPQITTVNHYYDNPKYIYALAESVRKEWAIHGQPQKLLMSFHGIPQRNVDLGDPYYKHCQITAQLLAAELSLSEEQWQISFQSRLGRAQWLTPYTVDALKKLASQGVKKVDVICPAFAADCLETLEEIAIENRRVFLSAGGETYHLIPCLNDGCNHSDMMVDLVMRYLPRL